MATKKKHTPEGNIVAQNRKARHDYTIEETFEAGIMLLGSEVKSLRAGHCSLVDSFANDKDGQLFLNNAYIPEYAAAQFSHEPRAPRKLLLHRREIARLSAAISRQGKTLVPLSIYFNDRGIAKVELALATGKHKYDKRAAQKDRDWKMQKSRLLRDT